MFSIWDLCFNDVFGLEVKFIKYHIMSILDDNIIIDPIQSLITRYLINHADDIIGGGYAEIEKFYKCDLITSKFIQVDYDDQPETWYLMKSFVDNKVYISKFILGNKISELNLYELRHPRIKNFERITLKDVLDELA